MDRSPRRRILVVSAILLGILLAAAPFLWIRTSRALAARAELAKEASMRAALHTLRDTIAEYRETTGRYPHSLAELGIDIPVDPVTRSSKTWQVTTEEVITPSSDFTATATAPANETVVVDVRSGAPGNDAHGKAWSAY